MFVCLNVVVNKRDDDHSVLRKLHNRVKTTKHKNTKTKFTYTNMIIHFTAGTVVLGNRIYYLHCHNFSMI